MEQTILVVGIKHASVSLQEVYKKLSSSLFSEKIMVATCNRTEIYIVTPDKESAEKALKRIEHSDKYLYTNEEAVAHLFEVVCGIDSVVLGELEILGQIRKSYLAAITAKTVGPILHQLYKEALHVGKLVRTKTAIAAGSSSIAHAVRTLSEKQREKNEKYKTLIIGAGEVAQQTAKSLMHHTEITITNRTDDTALNLAKEIGGKLIPFDKLETALPNFDVIVTATASQQILISAAMVKKIMKKRDKKLSLIDLSVPNNIDQQVINISQVSFYNLNDVQQLMNKNRSVREQSIAAVKELIEIHTKKFWQWHIFSKIAPMLEALTNHAISIQQTELKRSLQKLQYTNLTEKEQQIITQLSTRITNKLLDTHIKNIKRMSMKYPEENISLLLD